MCSDYRGPYFVSHARTHRASLSSLDHAGRPVGRKDPVAALRHPHRIEARATTEVEQVALLREARIEPLPHLPAHVLDQRIVAPGTVVMGRDAVECGARIVKGICAHAG